MKKLTYKGVNIEIKDGNMTTLDGEVIPVMEKNGKYGVFYNQNHDTIEEALKAFIDTQH